MVRSRSPDAQSDTGVYPFDHAPKANSENLANYNDDTRRVAAGRFIDRNEMTADGSSLGTNTVETCDAGVVVLRHERT